MSLIFRNQPTKPIKAATFWIEYVIRNHQKGRHLISEGPSLSWVKYNNLDVLGFVYLIIISCMICIGYISFRLMKFGYNLGEIFDEWKERIKRRILN